MAERRRAGMRKLLEMRAAAATTDVVFNERSALGTGFHCVPDAEGNVSELRVTDIEAGSQAERQRVRAGWRVVGIGGRPVVQFAPQQALAALKARPITVRFAVPAGQRSAVPHSGQAAAQEPRAARTVAPAGHRAAVPHRAAPAPAPEPEPEPEPAPAPQPAPAPAPAPPARARRSSPIVYDTMFYVTEKDGQNVASEEVSVARVRSLIASGDVTAETRVWAEGMAGWAQLRDCADLFGLAITTSPPRTPSPSPRKTPPIARNGVGRWGTGSQPEDESEDEDEGSEEAERPLGSLAKRQLLAVSAETSQRPEPRLLTRKRGKSWGAMPRAAAKPAAARAGPRSDVVTPPRRRPRGRRDDGEAGLSIIQRRAQQQERAALSSDLATRWRELGGSDRALTQLQRQLRGASYGKGGQDPRKLFKHYDRDNSGDIDQDEFRNAVRKGGRLTAAMLSDTDLDRLFVCADTDDSGAVSIDEMIALVWDSDSEGPAAPAE